jgi:hypothetical protein
MTAKLQYVFETTRCTLRIIKAKPGRWEAMADGETLGIYRTPDGALEALLEETAESLSGIPDDLSGWEYVKD